MPLRFQIDQKLERKFREIAMKRFGYGKGALSKAAEEAIMKWISTIEKENLSFEGPCRSHRRTTLRYKYSLS